jgi:hypothetical protein
MTDRADNSPRKAYYGEGPQPWDVILDLNGGRKGVTLRAKRLSSRSSPALLLCMSSATRTRTRLGLAVNLPELWRLLRRSIL